MRNLKIAVALVLAVSLLCGSTSALAQETRTFSAKGTITEPTPVTVFAPMGGQLLDFSWKSGDRVETDAVALSLRPTQICAANDGTIRNLYAKVGDQAAAIQAQYGALCYVERTGVWRIKVSTTSAYDHPDNRDIYIGQLVRLQHGTGDDKVKGDGTVISVGDKEFVVELPQGDFEVEDSTKVYLGDSKDNATKDQLGSGKIARAEALPVNGTGTIAQILVKEGDQVTRGQPLFILDDASARHAEAQPATPEVKFLQAGLIGEVLVRPGQFVQQGQALMTLLPTDALEALLEVDELDISKVRVGDMVRMKVDAYQDDRTGTVKEIKPIGKTVLDTTKFMVKVTFERPSDLMIGMHVTGYWGQ